MSATSSKGGPSTAAGDNTRDKWIPHERPPPKSTFYTVPKFLRWNSPEMNTIGSLQQDRPTKKPRISQANMNKRPLPDYAILTDPYEFRPDNPAIPQVGYRFAFKFTNLCHVTSWSDDEKEGIKGILNDRGFRGGMKAIDQTKAERCLSWWAIDTRSAKVRLEDSKWSEMANIKSVAKRLVAESGYETEVDDAIADSFCNSPAFVPESHYGNYKFTIPLKELFKSYESSLCKEVTEEPKSMCRVGGTFHYPPWEIMHAVIVHPNSKDINDEFERLEQLKIDGFGIVTVSGDRSSGIWRPDSTSNKMWHWNDLRFWNSAGFAFYMKDDKQKMEFDENKLISYLSICEAVKPRWGNFKLKATREDARKDLLDWAKKKNVFTALRDHLNSI